MSREALRPVFIGGCPRSGTTLLGAMLVAHPDCLATPESQFKTDLLGAWERGDLSGGQEAISAYLAKHWRFRLWGIDPPQGVRSGVPSERALVETVQQAVQEYGRKVDRANARNWVDHTPANLRWAAQLGELFPGAKFIHLVRDARAVAASVLPLDWGPNTPMAAARWWLSELSHGLLAERAQPASGCLRVRYEDLVLEPEETLRGIADFLEFETLPSMTDTDGFMPPRYTQPQHEKVGQPIDSSRVDAWRQTLKPRQIEQLEYFLGDVLQALGYAPDYGIAAVHPSWWEQISGHAYELYRSVWNRVRQRSRRLRA